jgi:hypothetical protein
MPAPGKLPPLDTLKELFEYQDGHLYWRKSHCSAVKVGAKAGCINSEGYLIVGYKYKKYLVHRIIWVMHGNEPVPLVDHINSDKLDNRIENLRAADPTINTQNAKLRKDSTSGIKGVSWQKQTGTWVGQIWHKNKLYRAGSFSDKAQCAKAVRRLREELHGDYARHQ